MFSEHKQKTVFEKKEFKDTKKTAIFTFENQFKLTFVKKKGKIDKDFVTTIFFSIYSYRIIKFEGKCPSKYNLDKTIQH